MKLDYIYSEICEYGLGDIVAKSNCDNDINFEICEIGTTVERRRPSHAAPRRASVAAREIHRMSSTTVANAILPLLQIMVLVINNQ